VSSFADHFSGHAARYARHRLVYPPGFFEAVAALAPSRAAAWDCGAGNGQAAVGLASVFERVVASEPSEAQLAHALPHPRVEYRREPAEHSTLDPQSIDAAIAAQAAHWFDAPRWHSELRRVLKPGGLVVASTYAWPEIAPDIDRVVVEFTLGDLGPYWPPEARLVHGRYADLPFPFAPVRFPAFACEDEVSLEGFLAVVGTWSGTRRAAEATSREPTEPLRSRLAPLWGDRARTVRWPIAVRAGRVG
jgi:SAM-dependent methyltransferase